jgi:hypothetical protein
MNSKSPPSLPWTEGYSLKVKCGRKAARMVARGLHRMEGRTGIQESTLACVTALTRAVYTGGERV